MMKKTLFTGAMITGAALLLSACGFKPVHSTGKIADTPAFKSIKIELVDPDRAAQKEAGYYLQQHLYDRLGKNAGPHVLRLETRSGRRPYGVTASDVATRYDLIMRVNYELINSVTGKKLDTGDVTSTSTFGSSRDPYARISAEKNASEQVARDAADRILIRLAAYYNDPDKHKRAQEEKIQKRLEQQAAESAGDAPVTKIP